MWSRLGILTDEVSPDIDTALDFAKQHELCHVELRSVNGINVVDLDDKAISAIHQSVVARGLFVSCIASPVFKCSLHPSDGQAAKGDLFGAPEADLPAHINMLARAISIASQFNTRYIRVFSFWREPDRLRHEDIIVEHLRTAAKMAQDKDVILLLENEPSCNGGFAEEVARLVRRVDSSALRALWDPGNEVYGGGVAFPEAYHRVRSVLSHVHIKDARQTPDIPAECVPVGEGSVPWLEQLYALDRDGYDGLYTIETHYIPEGKTAADGSALTLEGLRRMTTFGEQQVDDLKVEIHPNRGALGQAAAAAVARCIRTLLSTQEIVRMVFAAAPSQNEFLDSLAQADGIDWERVTALHMDEYIGLPAGHAQLFSTYLSERFFTKVKPGRVHLIDPTNGTEQACRSYTEIIREAPIDIVCLGIGENGHLAFNDPGVAKFDDKEVVKVVELDEKCRMQQVHDGCFPSLDAVPTHAVTLTIPTLLHGRHLFCMVPGKTKSDAVNRTLNAVVSEDCPATILRKHNACVLYVDENSYGASATLEEAKV